MTRVVATWSFVMGLVWLAAGGAPAAERFNIAPHGDFEEPIDVLNGGFSGWIPLGVVADADTPPVRVVDNVAHTGRQSLRVEPGPAGPVTGSQKYADYNGGEGSREITANDGVRGVRTFAMRLDPAARGLNASVWVRHVPADTISLTAVWTTRRDRRPVVEIRRDTTTHATSVDGDWQRLELHVMSPATALQVQLWIESDGLEPFYVDDAELCLAYRRDTRLLVDQLGYETTSRSKTAVLQSTVPLERLSAARLVDASSGRVCWEGDWRDHGLLPEWDRYHRTVDFSAFSRPGEYRLAVDCDGRLVVSPPFRIATDLVTGATAELAHRFYYFQRCGIEIPGFHAACHLDDARLADGTWQDLTGGWHDAGDYNKYNGLTPEAVYALAWAFRMRPDLYADEDHDGNHLPDILDEALWGARFVEKMLDPESLELLAAVSSGYHYWGPPEAETDNVPHSGDERPVQPGHGDSTFCAPGFALVGKALVENGEVDSAYVGRHFIELAERMYQRHGGGMTTLVALFDATAAERYQQLAHQRAQELLDAQRAGDVSGFRDLAMFADVFPGDALKPRIRPLAERRVAELAANCDDRFGVACRRNSDGAVVYCREYSDVNDWYVGETSQRLDAAIDALWADRMGAAGARKIAEDQVHWLLGRNPLGVSLMEGVGTSQLPSYHHRYNAIPNNPRGAVPGALVNGMIRAWPHVDRPWLDLCSEPNADYHSNEPWLLHNNRWLMLIALW